MISSSRLVSTVQSGSREITLMIMRLGRCILVASMIVTSVAAMLPSTANADTIALTPIGAMAEYANWAYRDNGGLAGQYAAGYKHLAYVNFSLFDVLIGEAEGALYIDLDDYYSSIYTDTWITGEGRDGWITIWLDAGVSAISGGLPAAMGLTEVPTTGAEKDPSRSFEVSGPQYCAGIVQMELLEKTTTGYNWGTPNAFRCVGFNVSIASLSFNALRFEIQRSTLDEILNVAFASATPGVISSDRLVGFAQLITDGLFEFDGYKPHVRSPNEWPWRPFTNTDDNGNRPPVAGLIEYVWGGLDLDGNRVPDNVYPIMPEGIGGIPYAGVRFEVTMRTLGNNTANYYIEVLDVPAGWLVAAHDNTDVIPLLDRAYNLNNIMPLSNVETVWSVSCIANAPDSIRVRFRLRQDLIWPLEDPILDTAEITFAKSDAVVGGTVPVIEHIPITTAYAGESLTIQATITDDQEIQAAWLHYRDSAGGSYIGERMTATGDSFQATVPGAAVTVNGLDYYLYATDGAYNVYDPSSGEYHVTITRPDSSPTLSSPQILPGTSGNTTTSFQFQVIYTDADNEPPASVVVVIDSTQYSLSSSDTTYVDGAIFTSSPRTFNTGVHSYYFRATQGSNVVTTSPLNFYVSQSADGHDLRLLILELDRSSAEQGDSVTIRAQINNVGNYAESGITANAQVTGPGGYSWQNSVNIGSLASGGIWGLANLATWNIPSTAANGEYFVQVTVSSIAGDQNWSDNTRSAAVYVSNEPPLAHMAYKYLFYRLNWNDSPGIPGWSGGAYGPVSTSYGGKTYTVYMYIYPTSSSSYRMYIRDQNGIEYQDFYDGSINRYRSGYADNDNILYQVGDMVFSSYAWVRLGHPEPSASIVPAVQNISMDGSGTYMVHIPCSSCSYSPRIFEGTGGDDPPDVFFDRRHDDWDISGNGQDFTVTAIPYDLGLKTFAFDTYRQDLTTQNYLVYGKFSGYQPVDNLPEVMITSPSNGQTVFGNPTFAATATDDKGIARLEFYVDGALSNTDTASPYSYAWNTTAVGEGNHTLRAVAYDTAGQTDSHTITVTVDNNPPLISGVSHSPANPTNSDVITVEATIADVSGISVAVVHYSADGGSNWTQRTMNNVGGNVWRTTIPARDAGTMLYKIAATDALARTTTTSNYSYVIRDSTPPIFFGWVETPADLTEDWVGTFRIQVSVSDMGGSGLAGQIPQLDYRFGTVNYDGYENMTSAGGSSWYFDIPAQNWDARKGQTVYYKVRSTDAAGNVGTSNEQSELVDSINDPPEINSFSPADLTPEVIAGTCLSFSVTAQDDDGDLLTYQWMLSNTTVSTVANYTYCPSVGDIGDHAVTALVNDGAATAIRGWQVTVNTNPVATPSGLQAVTASETQINLSWIDNSSDESDFHIERSPNGSTGWAEIVTVGANVTSYSNTGLTCGTTYYYRVRAHRSGDSQYSGYSSTATATTQTCPAPTAPSNLNASAASQTQINLSWTDNSSDESDFHIERSPSGSTGWAEIATVGTNVTSYSNTGLACGTTYYYRVRAHRSSDNQYSSYSSTATATTQTCPGPNAPSNLNASAASQTQINLSWIDNSSDESDFHIERSPSGSTGWAEIATVGANVTSYSNTGLACGTTYYYRVRAYRSSDNQYSNYSSVASVTTLPCSFNKSSPANGATGQLTNPTLSWGSSNGASSYEYCYDTTNNNACNASWISAGNNTSAGLSGLSAGTTYYWQVRARNAAGTTDANSGTWWSLAVSLQVPNDDFSNSTIVSTVPYYTTQSIAGATTAADDPTFSCVSGQKYNSVWYRYTPSTSGHLLVNTFGSTYDTVLGIWTGTRGSLQGQRCNNDTSGLQSMLTVPVVPGTTYYIEVVSFNSGSSGVLNLSVLFVHNVYLPVVLR